MPRLIKRIFLITLLASIALSALMGIIAILSDMNHEWGIKLFFSALTIAGASLACFVSSIPLEKRRFPVLAWSGILLPLLAAFLCIVLIWAWEPIQEVLGYFFYPKNSWRASELMGKFLVSFIYLAIAVSASAALLSPRLRSVGFWIQITTVALIAGGFIMEQPLMWFLYREEFLWKMWGISLILSFAGLITTPIIARFFTIKTDEELTALTRTLHLTCPRCLTPQDMLVGESRCSHCKLKFKLEVEEPRCPKCNYILHGLTQPRCPECGDMFSSEELSAQSTPSIPPTL